MRMVACFVAIIGFGLTIHFSANAPDRTPEPSFKPLRVSNHFGPFRSWLDVKRDFGAKGDGVTDDTEALQRALDAVRPESPKATVVFIPSGTYRITKTLQLIRQAHAESHHIIVIGEHPDTTVIRWDGENEGVMVSSNAWYASIRRLTLDGAGKAKTAVLCGPNFVTYNEFTDMVFRDVAFGIEAGRMETQGVAETAVVRCKFLRCSQAGISIQNWNSLDWFVWHCVFEDCRFGVTNAFGAGNFHIYESVFRRSKEADASMGHAGYFSLRGNISFNSQAFFKASWLGACGFLTFQRNFVIEPKQTAIEVNNLGPVLLLDNVFVTGFAPVVKVRHDAGFLSLGNTFTVKDAIDANPKSLRLDDKIEPSPKLKVAAFEQLAAINPRTLPLRLPGVIEVKPNSKTSDIQSAINFAAETPDETVIHFPAGVYNIDKPLVIPSRRVLRLVGDGGRTILRWIGAEGGTVLRVMGPTHLAIHDLMIDGARKANGIVVENCNQKGARVIADQLNIAGAQETGLLVETPKHVDVNLFNINHANCKLAIKVNGGKLTIFSGASSNNELSYEVAGGGELLVRDIWYETNAHPRFASFRDSGTFTMHAARVATPDKPADVPVVEVDNFRGKVTFIGTNFTCAPQSMRPKVLVKGDGKNTKLLLLGCGSDGDADSLVNRSPHATVSVLDAFKMLPGGAWEPALLKGFLMRLEPNFLREMLLQTRQAMPQTISPVSTSINDLRFHRVLVFNTRNGVMLKR
ncbi:MAG: glycosyl hydrolase family 28-related protein [Armatimonadota bacterium]